MISINNLAFSYGSLNVLSNITMTLEEGRIYGLLGENGVGKTTLLTLLAGLKKPQAGSILTDGVDPFKRLPSFLQDQYYLPDEVLPCKMTASSWAKSCGELWPLFDYGKFVTIMKEFETDPSAKMNKMSSGQLKKTYISFALSCGAKYLLMDEPTNGLDIPSKTQFRSAITKYTADDSVIVISTHQVRDLENIIDPIIILDRQEVLLNASLEEITSKLFFDYGNVLNPDSLYSERLPGGFIQVYPNTEGVESKVNIEALFNAVHSNKQLVKGMFTK
ncbi:MAG: ATP-binding cassette domain-containing protein [Bacteroidales bacterium]|nr:ATP-binding cassette domain-containing protein [Bacteroidales bacterium]MBQ6576622.1 ATP-binding cassette domain-containing protein [Bacteroidales bacterium]